MSDKCPRCTKAVYMAEKAVAGWFSFIFQFFCCVTAFVLQVEKYGTSNV